MGVLLLNSSRVEATKSIPISQGIIQAFSLSVFIRPKTTKTHIKMPDQPEVVAAEVPVEDQVDAPLKEAAKEAVEAPADNGECAAELSEMIKLSILYLHWRLILTSIP